MTALPLDRFATCSSNPVTLRWSGDGKRAYASSSTDRGDRVELLDLRGRRVIASAYAWQAQPSPDLTHLAWTPWYATSSTPLYVDGAIVWGTDDPRAATRVSQLAWRSELELEFCGTSPNGLDELRARYRVTLGKRAAVARVGDCAAPTND